MTDSNTHLDKNLADPKTPNHSETAMDEDSSKTQSHKVLGFGFMAVSTLLWVVALAIPFLDYSLSDSAWIIGALIVIAEILFYLGVWFLGKGLWQKYKQQLLDKLEQLKKSSN